MYIQLKKHLAVFTVILFLLSFWSCKEEVKAPDLSNTPTVDLELKRFEQDLFSVDTTQVAASLGTVLARYPSFYPFFIQDLMSYGSLEDPQSRYMSGLAELLRDRNHLMDSVNAAFPDLSNVEKELETAFRYQKYHMPNAKVPRQLISHISTFGPAALTYGDDILGLNLDVYLGKDCPFYPAVGLSYYMYRRFEPEFIVPKSMRVWAQNLYPMDERKAQLIDHMVYQGKILYYLDQVLPHTHDSLKIGFTKKQLDWCEQNEQMMWTYFIKNELLYNGKYREYSKYVTEHPTTPGMPSSSPGRTGWWMGWQIVRKFMRENPNVSLEQLMEIKSGREIMEKARYKPSR